MNLIPSNSVLVPLRSTYCVCYGGPAYSTGDRGRNKHEEGRKGKLQRGNLLNPEHHVSSCCPVLPVTQDFGPAHMSPHDMSQPSR